MWHHITEVKSNQSKEQNKTKKKKNHQTQNVKGPIALSCPPCTMALTIKNGLRSN